MEDFPSEFVQPFKVCFDLLSRSYIHFYDNNSVTSSFRGKISCIFFIFCAAVYHCSLLAYISKIFKGEIYFFDLAHILPPFMVITQGILKAAIVVPKKAEIKVIIAQLGILSQMDNLSEVQIKKKNDSLKRLNICHSVFYWMNILGSWQYMLMPLCLTLFKTLILQQQSELLFPFACSLPFDATKNLTRYIAVYIFQTHTMIHLIYIYLGAEFLLITLCAHLSIEFSLLQEELRHLKPSSNENRQCNDTSDFRDDDSGVAKDIVKKHQNLIKISTELDEIFNKLIFINLLFATITICFFGFVATMSRGSTDMINNFVGVFASMLPIFNLCYYGELLTRASVGVADSAYESLWYKGDIGYQKMLSFIIMRSLKPCCLTSLKYAPVSLGTFTTVMSTTWSYFSLVTSLYKEKSK